MTIHDILVSLSALLRINTIFLFLFLDNRMMPLRRRLDELPTIGPGMTLLLQRWSLKQSLAWSNEWRCLTMAETKTIVRIFVLCYTLTILLLTVLG